MATLYEKFNKLKIDGSQIGFEKGETEGGYYCTPIGAKVIGWDNGIHYCYIEGLGETVFCVNPENYGDELVYPIANNFEDFLRLILATYSANTLMQIILWDKSQYMDFINDPWEVENRENEEVKSVIKTISDKLNLTPMENPFEYVKAIQKDFDYSLIKYTDEYYDTLGIDNPDE